MNNVEIIGFLRDLNNINNYSHKFGAYDLYSDLLQCVVVSLMIVLVLLIYIIVNQYRINNSIEYKSNSSSLKIKEELAIVKEQLLLLRSSSEESKVVETNDDWHSFVIKLSDEVVRLNNYLTKVDPGIRGYRSLKESVTRIERSINGTEYNIRDLLYTPYDDRMNIEVSRFISNPSLKNEEKIISKVIRPQVEFKGNLIQKAKIEVEVN